MLPCDIDGLLANVDVDVDVVVRITIPDEMMISRHDQIVSGLPCESVT